MACQGRIPSPRILVHRAEPAGQLVTAAKARRQVLQDFLRGFDRGVFDAYPCLLRGIGPFALFHSRYSSSSGSRRGISREVRLIRVRDGLAGWGGRIRTSAFRIGIRQDSQLGRRDSNLCIWEQDSPHSLLLKHRLTPRDVLQSDYSF
jgi:hypothetical protein